MIKLQDITQQLIISTNII